MNNLISDKRTKTIIIIVHIILGLIAQRYTFVGFAWLISAILYGLFEIIRTKNSTGIAHCMAAYIAGSEVLFRMLGTTLLWETSKYVVILFLSIGLVYRRAGSFSFLPVIIIPFISC